MDTKKIVTNLRVEEENWTQVKIVAAELGISINEYINSIIEKDISKIYLEGINKNKISIYDSLSKLAKKKYKRKPLGFSDDDKIIYDI